jgi:hypothetical protein
MSNLNDLNDVNAGSPANKDALVWDTSTSKWINSKVIPLLDASGTNNYKLGKTTVEGDFDYSGDMDHTTEDSGGHKDTIKLTANDADQTVIDDEFSSTGTKTVHLWVEPDQTNAELTIEFTDNTPTTLAGVKFTSSGYVNIFNNGSYHSLNNCQSYTADLPVLITIEYSKNSEDKYQKYYINGTLFKEFSEANSSTIPDYDVTKLVLTIATNGGIFNIDAVTYGIMPFAPGLILTKQIVADDELLFSVGGKPIKFSIQEIDGADKIIMWIDSVIIPGVITAIPTNPFDANSSIYPPAVQAAWVDKFDTPSMEMKNITMEHNGTNGKIYVLDMVGSVSGDLILGSDDGDIKLDSPLDANDKVIKNPGTPTLGGHIGDRDFNDGRYLRDLVEDTTPQLGGSLATMGNTIQFTSVTLEDILDQDDMASNSAVKGVTQQSVKAYADGILTSLSSDLGTDWVNLGSGFATAQYWKIGHTVFLKGVIKDGASVNSILTMPEGLRPAETTIFMTLSDNALCRLDMNTDGLLYNSFGASDEWISLNGLHYRVA